MRCVSQKMMLFGYGYLWIKTLFFTQNSRLYLDVHPRPSPFVMERHIWRLGMLRNYEGGFSEVTTGEVFRQNSTWGIWETISEI